MPRRPDQLVNATEWREPAFLADDGRAARFERFAETLESLAREAVARQRIRAYLRALLSLAPHEATTNARIRSRATALTGTAVDDRFLSNPPFDPGQLLLAAASEARRTLNSGRLGVVDEFVFVTGVTEKSYGGIVQSREQYDRVYDDRAILRRRRGAKPRHVQRAIVVHEAAAEGSPVLALDVVPTDASDAAGETVVRMLKTLLLESAPAQPLATIVVAARRTRI